MVRKLRSVWKPARIVSLAPYLVRSEAVGARRCGLRSIVNVLHVEWKGDAIPVSPGVFENSFGQTEADGGHFSEALDAGGWVLASVPR